MSELTRKGVEALLANMSDWHDCGDECNHNLKEILDTDAALRATIEQQAQELERVKAELDDQIKVRDQIRDDWRERLTTMTTERDGLREQMNAIAHTRTFEQSCQTIADLKQQLAAAQATINELTRRDVQNQERELKWAECFQEFRDIANGVARPYVQSHAIAIQQQLAALQARVTELEAVE